METKDLSALDDYWYAGFDELTIYGELEASADASNRSSRLWWHKIAARCDDRTQGSTSAALKVRSLERISTASAADGSHRQLRAQISGSQIPAYQLRISTHSERLAAPKEFFWVVGVSGEPARASSFLTGRAERHLVP